MVSVYFPSCRLADVIFVFHIKCSAHIGSCDVHNTTNTVSLKTKMYSLHTAACNNRSEPKKKTLRSCWAVGNQSFLSYSTISAPFLFTSFSFFLFFFLLSGSPMWHHGRNCCTISGDRNSQRRRGVLPKWEEKFAWSFWPQNLFIIWLQFQVTQQKNDTQWHLKGIGIVIAVLFLVSFQ